MRSLRAISLAAVLSVYACALAVGPLTAGGYAQQDREHAGEGPGAAHWLGTDALGRDRLVRLLYGARTSLVLAPAAALLAAALATAIGSAAALAGGPAERAALYLVDVVAGTPWFFALLMVRAVLPLNVEPAVSVAITFAILGLLGWPQGVRPIAARSTYVLRSEFLRQARASGIGRLRLLRRHVAPNLAPVVAAHFWGTLPVFILAEANLSLLGLGVAEPLPSLGSVVTADAGPTTDVEMLWFNQAGGAPLPGYKKAWFASREFRQGVDAAINRDDIVRLVYRTWAQPAAGPLPPSSLWFNRKLRAQPHDPEQARRWFERAGFVYSGGQLRDARGNPVAFSIVTNSSSNVRDKIAALIQQDLQKVGVKVTLAPLEFRSLIQRIGETADYEACLLGMVNVDDDPNGQMNVWLSSSANHPWNPAQQSPATPWEAEIDGLMTRQASSADQRIRKEAFDRVQELVREQAPVIYLVNPHALVAYASELRGLEPAPSRPHLFWNIERLSFDNRGGATDVRTAAAH